MSGRKYSEVELANNVREAIRCRLAAEEALSRAESLTAALTDAARTTDALGPAAQTAEETLSQIREELRLLSEQFQESRLMRLDLSEVRRRRARVESLRTKLQTIIHQCREGQSAAGLRAELARVEDELARSHDALEPWLRDVYETYTRETRGLSSQADQEIRATGSLGSLSQQILAHGAELQGMLDRASERRGQDAERRYAAEMLRQVCVSQMGFSARLLPQNGPLDDLVVEVDTMAYGIIHFRLQLDGVIRSQSEMVVASCPANFKEIEKNLRSLGVISNFRYEGDQSPVVITDDAKPLPNDELLVFEKRGW
ncbi:MAG: hypothetical protein ACREAM_03295 [Blastocatellia bacterium]